MVQDMSIPKPSIQISVDLFNPGQFFACCGLLELADRLWPGAEGWFESGEFSISCDGTLGELLEKMIAAELKQVDPTDDMSSPMILSDPFDLYIDWWTDCLSDGIQLKVWAGSMRNVRIARAMQKALTISDPQHLFEYATVVYDPDSPSKKVEPFYFDSRRGLSARSRDIGFAPDALKMQTMAYPAVEILCLLGIQRFRPLPTKRRRFFIYYAWFEPLPPQIASVVCNGTVSIRAMHGYQFENGFRTDQKKHKSFLPANRIGG